MIFFDQLRKIIYRKHGSKKNHLNTFADLIVIIFGGWHKFIMDTEIQKRNPSIFTVYFIIFQIYSHILESSLKSIYHEQFDYLAIHISACVYI